MILHIPHASTNIPGEFRDQFILNNDELDNEFLHLTDAYTDELFTNPKAQAIHFPYSRLLVDVERFPNDDQESMSKVGMGMIYTHTSGGSQLRRRLSKMERTILKSLYDEHHMLLSQSVEDELTQNGQSLIVDCHSFPSKPLRCDSDQTTMRPDICLGVDGFHTSGALVTRLEETFRLRGFSVEINRPYAGTIVPLKYYGGDHRVQSIMIEINRKLYMHEPTGEKLANFAKLQQTISEILLKVWI